MRAWALLLALCAAGCDGKKPVLAVPGSRPALSDKSPEQLDQEALADLVAAGKDPTREHPLRHVLLFGSEQELQDAGVELAQAGYQIRMRRNRSAPPGREFMLLAEAPLVPSQKNLQVARQTLGEVAKRHGGLYDGWELELPAR